MADTPEGLLANAERMRLAMLNQASDEAAAAIDAATAQGASEGQQQAQHMLEEIERLHARLLAEVDAQVIRTAVEVARDLLQQEMAQRDEMFVDVVLTAISTVRGAKDVNLRVHPRDAAMARAHKDRMVSLLTRAKDLEIREDRRVAPGGALLETEAGVVDAQLDTQLEELARVLGA
jgi:type III secretion protein L